MNKFGEVLAISDLKKVDDNDLTRKLNSFIEELDLEVEISQKKLYKECLKYLKETFQYIERKEFKCLK